jgi:hypothetical protein
MIADTPAAFAEAVVQVLSDTSLRERIALGGYEMVKTRYDWAVQVQAYHRLYRWLAGQGRRVVGPWREGGTKRNRDSKTVFASTLVARLNHILLPVGLGYLTPKAAWMLLAAHLRDSYRDYLRRSGRRPRTWGIPSLDFGFTSDSLGPAPARRDDRPPHGPDEARRLIAEREELIARVCDLEQENRRLIDERDTKKTDREMATIDGVALPRRSDDEPALERRSLGGPNRMELPRTPEESGWNSLQMRVDAIEGKLSDIKVRSAELEASLHKLRQDGRRHEVRARQESAAAR